jgi:hypothetical protein
MRTWKMHVINMKKVLIFLLTLLALSGHLQAQDSLTVEEAVGYALRNNYDILLARQDSAIAAINYDYRNAAFLPRVSATGSAIFSNNNQKQTLADGSDRVRNGIRQNALSGSVNLNWTVFDGFRMFLLRNQLDIAVKGGNLIIKSAVVNSVGRRYYHLLRYSTPEAATAQCGRAAAVVGRPPAPCAIPV